MKLGEEILFLSDADIQACGLSPAEVNAGIEAMFAAKAAGKTAIRPKLSINLANGQQFQAKAGVMTEPAFAVVKWVCPTPRNEHKGLPSYRALIILNDSETGLPLAFMDGKWITGARTAAISVVAAKYLAREDSETAGFLACGLQAYSHLEGLRAAFPIRRVVAYSRREQTARTFAAHVEGLGLEAEVTTEPRQVLERSDILISSVPHGRGPAPYLDGDWLRHGGFVSLPDLGHCFHGKTLGALDKVVTDDLEQSAPGGPEKLNYPFPYYGEIAQLVSGEKAGRQSPDERNAVVFSGIGLGDVPPAAAVYERALEKGLGQVLEL